MYNEQFTTDIAQACRLCGLQTNAFRQETAANWEQLASLYLNIQVAADLIASSDGFDPDNPHLFNTAYLYDSFQPGSVAMIVRVATLMGHAIKGREFDEMDWAVNRTLQ
ncbi:MAG: hypothetical protein AAF724_09425 [Pseudomonadota bacterium]